MKGLTLIIFTCLALALPTHADEPLFTEVFIVPPTFLTWTLGESHDEGGASGNPQSPPTAETALSRMGVTFGEGAKASLNKETSQLMVINTEAELAIVQAYLDTIISGVERQVLLRFREVEVSADTLATIGMGPLVQGNRSNAAVTLQKRTESEMEKVRKIISESSDSLSLLDINAMLRSGSGISDLGGMEWGVSCGLGPDDCTIDLMIHMPAKGTALAADWKRSQPDFRTTIWDSETVAILLPGETLDHRLIFIHGGVKDPAGMKLSPDDGRIRLRRHSLKQMHIYPTERPVYSVHHIHDSVLKLFSPKVRRELKQTDSLILGGARFLATDQYEKAAGAYRRALGKTPDHLLFTKRRESLQARLDHAGALMER